MNPLELDAPDQIVIMGDLHGNTLWTVNQIRHINQEHPNIRVIIQLGDFGIWPVKNSYIRDVSLELEKHDITLMFVDGNHEWHDKIDEWHIDNPGPVAIDKHMRIWHLPRGTRWEWHGKKWLAVGGAGSPDKTIRTEGKTWWPQELITVQQMEEISASGPADVMISHDCPKHFMPPKWDLPKFPSWWDLTDCEVSSGRLQTIMDATGVTRVFHGHMHMTLDSTRYGIHVTGLDMDGRQGNWIIIDTRTL